MRAKLILHDKGIDDTGNIVEIKLWKTLPSKDKPHGYKYSLAYIVDGIRVIGYDNSEQKGDHKHINNVTEAYRFIVSSLYSTVNSHE
ncbi:hypothetical protein MBAV_005265 [Candidatus Magnetobacterium bavaricum]|uniref:Uncharacterized protein n=1 Tax=Candidatus Magnetobacterium bavaricum TaxID=29290 RepID=A0A0F3GKW9_9BACT|nr:hypothetical protein MBAV_005265 [Candidatus Magnetobacterium bavaricum]